MKVGDRVIVSAEATGLGKEVKGIVEKIETFLGSVLVTVNYISPSEDIGYGGTFVQAYIYKEQ